MCIRDRANLVGPALLRKPPFERQGSVGSFSSAPIWTEQIRVVACSLEAGVGIETYDAWRVGLGELQRSDRHIEPLILRVRDRRPMSRDDPDWQAAKGE
eukprot:10045962-Prorocentrum_lima.AAC.1